jgi:alpha-beta hydrolase superfamily lysophospholipase
MQHSESKFTAADGIHIYTQQWVADQPIANIVIVHGLGDHSDRYQNYVDYFVPRGYSIYSFELRGHGRSGGARGHVDRFEQYAEDANEVVTRIKQQSNLKLFMLGHSLGSLIALSYELHFPDRVDGMILSGTALEDALKIPPAKRALAKMLSRIAPKMKFDNGVVTEHLSHDPDVHRYDTDPLVHRFGTPRLATEVDAARLFIQANANNWRIPVLMLHGGDDRLCLLEAAQAFQKRLPIGLSEFKTYEGFFHEIHNEPGREIVFKDIENWLNERLTR